MTTPVAAATPSASDARRFGWACVAGGSLSMLVLVWLATRGFSTLFDTPRFGDLYDAQARALFDGHWDMSPDVLSFERFKIGDRYFMYFGPWPSLLRMPVLLVTDALDGRMSRLSMIVASTVVVFGIARLSWLARRSLRGGRPVSRGEAAAAGVIVVVASLGTVVPYVAGWTAVYHEAIQWGVAGALVSYGALVAWLLDHRTRDLVVAGAAAAVSVLARGSVGVGPVSALVLVAIARVVVAVRDRRSGVGPDWRTLGGLAAAVLVPVLLFASVNQTKFGTAFGTPPTEAQDALVDLPARAAALRDNGGSLFGSRYVPTTLLHYLRPDGVDLDRLFPWVLMRVPGRTLGGVVFESLRPTTSMTAASPLALVAALAGTALAVLRRRLRSAWLAPVAGTVVGALGALSLAFVDQRYLGDLLPALIVPGVLGAWALVARLPGRSRGLRVAVVTAVAVLAAWSVWVNVAAGYVYQRGQSLFGTVDDGASLVETQLDVHDLLGGGVPSGVRAGDALPPDGEGNTGELFVLGRCAGVYRHDGRRWRLVEQTPRTGAHRLRVFLDPDARGRQPVLSIVDDVGTTALWARAELGGRVGFEYQWEPLDPAGTYRQRIPMGSVASGSDGAVEVDAAFDRRDGVSLYLQLRADGHLLYDGLVTDQRGPARLGRQDGLDGAAALDGRVTRLPAPTPLCDQLVGLGLDVRAA